jgi:hypothetical protein
MKKNIEWSAIDKKEYDNIFGKEILVPNGGEKPPQEQMISFSCIVQGQWICYVFKNKKSEDILKLTNYPGSGLNYHKKVA